MAVLIALLSPIAVPVHAADSASVLVTGAVIVTRVTEAQTARPRHRSVIIIAVDTANAPWQSVSANVTRDTWALAVITLTYISLRMYARDVQEMAFVMRLREHASAIRVIRVNTARFGPTPSCVNIFLTAAVMESATPRQETAPVPLDTRVMIAQSLLAAPITAAETESASASPVTRLAGARWRGQEMTVPSHAAPSAQVATAATAESVRRRRVYTSARATLVTRAWLATRLSLLHPHQ